MRKWNINSIVVREVINRLIEGVTFLFVFKGVKFIIEEDEFYVKVIIGLLVNDDKIVDSNIVKVLGLIWNIISMSLRSICLIF